ncbi:flagellar export protein FliJ [Thermodesulfobacteriota bacterium]
MSFKFRYEALLKYRGHIKEKAEIDLSRAQNKLRLDKEHLSNNKKALIKANQNLDSDLRATITSSMLQAHSEHIMILKLQIEAGKVEIYNSDKIVQEKLKILQKITIQYKIIEKLREKDYKKWNQKQNYLEQKEMDEIAILRYGKDFL